MRTRALMLLLAVALPAVSACSFSDSSPKPAGPTVDVNSRAQQIITRIPSRPEYASVEKMLDKLGDSGLPCAGSLRRPHDDTLECYLPGGENLVASVFATRQDRDALLLRRLQKSWLPQVCVFGANWFVTLDADNQADRVAKALGGIVVRIGPPGTA
jgi:hypothetical protein